MANMIIGHASRDEYGKYSGGQAGDQDKKEVCTRSYYLHSKGWYLFRPKNVTHANAIAEAMLRACNNDNIGYDQSNRLGVIKYGTNSSVKTECDCSSLVRQCVKEGTGVDAGNFTTATEKSMLLATGLFENAVAVTSSTVMYNGDILVTKTKGHTVIVVSGNPRSSVTVSANTTSFSTYTHTQFVKDVQSAIGAKVDGIAGSETLSKTVTVSKSKNNKHAVVKAIQKYLYAIGYTSVGVADGIAGSNFDTAVKAFQKANGCVVDGVITAKNTTWKKLLKLS